MKKRLHDQKAGIALLIALFALLAAGCGSAPEVPSFEELLEINDLENVFKDHTNMYVTVDSKATDASLSYTEEVIYLPGEDGLCYHKRSKGASDTDYAYSSYVGNAIYYTGTDRTVVILNEGDDKYFDHTLDFRSTPVGKGYIENGQIVYHTSAIFEGDEFVAASRYDYTLRFNQDTGLLERMDYVSYDSEHRVDFTHTSTVSYDVADVESKFDKTACESVMTAENPIRVEVIVNAGTAAEASYSLTATADAQLWAAFNDVTYLLYEDAACEKPVETLKAYAGQESVTLYAKQLGIAE